jgi:hypothetical protein
MSDQLDAIKAERRRQEARNFEEDDARICSKDDADFVACIDTLQKAIAALRQRHAEAEAQTCATCRHRFVGMAPAGRPHFTYCKRTKVPVPALGTQTYVECRELGMRCGAWLASGLLITELDGVAALRQRPCPCCGACPEDYQEPAP